MQTTLSAPMSSLCSGFDAAWQQHIRTARRKTRNERANSGAAYGTWSPFSVNAVLTHPFYQAAHKE